MSDPASPMDKTKQRCPEPMVKEDNFLEPVPPFYEGQGFPYAPTDWPNPGDTWGWKVGKRISSFGYYTDRFLIPPSSLLNTSCPKHFASRRSIELYFLKEFPDADIDAFFASFIWRVPSTLWHPTKVKAASPSVKKVEEDENEETPVTVKKRKKHTAAASLAKQQTRHSLRLSVPGSNEGTDGKIDSSSLNEETATPSKDIKNTPDAQDDQPGSDSIEGKDSHVKCMPENFDSYIDSMDDILAQPLAGASLAYAATSSPTQEEELAEAQILEYKKAEALTLKKEYYEMKEKAAQLQTELDSDSLTVQEINDQIAKLQSERAVLMKTIKIKKKAVGKLKNDQKKAVNAAQKIVHEVQLANSKTAEWELKKENAAKQEAEILARFSPLKGFSL